MARSFSVLTVVVLFASPSLSAQQSASWDFRLSTGLSLPLAPRSVVMDWGLGPTVGATVVRRIGSAMTLGLQIDYTSLRATHGPMVFLSGGGGRRVVDPGHPAPMWEYFLALRRDLRSTTAKTVPYFVVGPGLVHCSVENAGIASRFGLGIRHARLSAEMHWTHSFTLRPDPFRAGGDLDLVVLRFDLSVL